MNVVRNEVKDYFKFNYKSIQFIFKLHQSIILLIFQSWSKFTNKELFK